MSDAEWSKWDEESKKERTRVMPVAKKFVASLHHKCKQCGSNKIRVAAQEQERSADEASTVYLECKCGNVWKS